MFQTELSTCSSEQKQPRPLLFNPPDRHTRRPYSLPYGEKVWNCRTIITLCKNNVPVKLLITVLQFGGAPSCLYTLIYSKYHRW